MRPDLIVEITLKASSDGGRSRPIPSVPFSCPAFFGDEGFDCRLLLDQVGVSLAPGDRATVPLKFLRPELIVARVQPGDEFRLWALGFFADGRVLEVLEPAKE